MSCLSIFQATLSIRESAALAVNLRAASRLPAPPRRAAVSLTACSSPLLPAGRDAQPASGRPCWDGLSWGAQHHPLCRCGRVVARGGRSQQPPVPVCRSNGDSPCTSRLPRSLGCGRCGLHEKGTQKSPPTLGHQHHRPSSPSIAPLQTPGTEAGQRPCPTGESHGTGRDPAREARGELAAGRPTGTSPARALPAARRRRGSSARGAAGLWGEMDLPRRERAAGCLRCAAAGQCRLSGTKSPVLLGHRSAEESEGTVCAEPDAGARE